MATQHVDLTPSAAVNVTDSLSLGDGLSYRCQVLGALGGGYSVRGTGTVRILERADAADLDFTDASVRAAADADAFQYLSGEEFTVRGVAGEEIFAWSEGGNARLVVSSGYS